MSVFSEKHPKNADLFFSSEKGGGVGVFFFQKFFLSVLDRPKTNIIRLSPYKIPPLVTPYPPREAAAAPPREAAAAPPREEATAPPQTVHVPPRREQGRRGLRP